MTHQTRTCDACAAGPALRLYEEAGNRYLLQLMVCEECYELLDRVGIRSPLARGLALGTISHGQGTAQAALESELAGAIASIALGVAAVFTSLVAPLLLPYL